MAKQKKKRNKSYTGADAAISRPIITKLAAADRSKIGQWWFDKKTVLKPTIITSTVVIVIIVLVYELIRVVSGG
jgi:hypothetical protein